MGASYRPDDPADLWDRLVKAGTPPDSATSLVAKKYGAPPAAPRDATNNPAPQAKPPSQILRSVEQGATFGFGDEINARVRSLSPNQTYDSALTDERAKLTAFKEDSPILAGVSEIGGAIGGGLLGGAAVGAAGKALGFVSKAIPAVTKTQKAVQVGKHVGQGALAGGAAAAGMSEGDVTDRLAAVPSGAFFGAGAVAGFKGLGKLANATGVTKVAQNLLPRPTNAASRVGQIANRAGIATHAENARADLIKQLERAGFTLDEVGTRAQAAHPEQMLLDAEIGGQSMLRRARGVHSIPSRGSEQVETALVTRNDAAPGRIQKALETESGHTRDNAVQRAAQLKGERSATAAVNYPKAYDAPPIEDGEVLALFSDPAFKRAHAIARRMAKREGIELPPLTRTSNVGGVTVQELIPQPVQAFDWMKHGLDDLIETGANGKQVMGRNEARITRNKLSQALAKIDAMPEHAEYAEARRAFREGSQVMEAQEMGANIFRTKNDEVAATLPSLSDDATTEFRRAALGATEERLGGMASGANAAHELTKNDILKEKIRHLFPDEASAERAFAALDTERSMHKNAAFVRGGSPTARILAEQADEMGAMPVGELASAASGSPSGLLSWLATNTMARRARGLSETQSSELAPLLTARGDELRRVIEELQEVSRRRQQQAAQGSRVTRAIGQTAGGAAGSP